MKIEGRDEGMVRVIETSDHKLDNPFTLKLLNACDPFIHAVPIWQNGLYWAAEWMKVS